MAQEDNVLRVIIKLSDRLFSIKADQILTMEVINKVREIPQAPPHVRGIVELRGKVIPLVDLRVVMGLGSFIDEISDLKKELLLREEDHRNWLAELESSVIEKRNFTLAKDPNLCAFGRWYNSFQTENLFLADTLKEFKTPHNRIHELAHKIEELKEKGEFNTALKLINETKETDLARLIGLFHEVQNILTERNNELFVVIQKEQKTFAVSVDSILAVDVVQPVERTEGSLFDFIDPKMKDLIESVGRNRRFEDLVINLNIDTLYEHLNLGSL